MLSCPPLLRDILRLSGARFARGNLEISNFCIKYLYDWFKPDTGPLTIDVAIGAIPPLYYVSMLGVDEMVLRLLAAGEEANSAGPRLTCLAAAAFFGHRTTVQMLFNKGAEVNAVVHHPEFSPKEYHSPTAIQCAAETGREDIVKMLLAEGADVSICRAQPPQPSDRGWLDFNTPLEAAVSRSSAAQTRIVQMLLDAGADVHAYGHEGSAELWYSPICRGDTNMTTLLLDAGVDLKIPLIDAIVSGKQQCVELLVERGAQLESIDSRLIPAIYKLRDTDDFLPPIEIALELKPDLNTEKLFFAAAKYGHIHSVKLMLRNGAAPDCHDENDVAALHAAAFTPLDDTKIIELLLDANANVNIHGGLFGSALQAAAMSGKAKAVQILLKRGASPDYAGGLYGTALQIAHNRLEAFEPGAYSYNYSWAACLRDYGPDGYLLDP